MPATPSRRIVPAPPALVPTRSDWTFAGLARPLLLATGGAAIGRRRGRLGGMA